MWVGFGVGFMVIGFAGESVLLVGRGGGGGPTVVEGFCVSWEVEHLCDREGGYQMVEKGIPPAGEEEEEYVLMGGDGEGRGVAEGVVGGDVYVFWVGVVLCWCAAVFAGVFGHRFCHACVRKFALFCILCCTEKASVLSLLRWFCCSCSSEGVFLLRVGGSSFGSYSFRFHHFRAYGGRRLFLSSQSCAKKSKSFRATCLVFFVYLLEPLRVSTSAWSSW